MEDQNKQEIFQHFYVVVDLDKKQKGKLAILEQSNVDEEGPFLHFESINGRSIWKENIHNIDSIERLRKVRKIYALL